MSQSRPEQIIDHFSHAMDVVREKKGNLYDYGAKFWISENVHAALLAEFDNIQIGIPYTLLGIPVEVAKHMDGMECSLSGKGWFSFSFTIPEKGTVDITPKRPIAPPPQPTLNMYPSWDSPNRVWQPILSFIDWLNYKAGAGKQKHKSKQSSEQMATIGELFESYEDEPDFFYEEAPPKFNPSEETVYK